MEARPTRYRRPTSFPSQDQLFDWIDRSRNQDLKRVQTLTLRLTDIDLSPVIDQSSPPRTTRASVWTLYQWELDRVDNALKALPNLSNLTIVPPRSGRSRLMKGLYHSFLALIPNRCPKLKRLEVQDGHEILEAIPGLKDVRGVICTGATSQPSEHNEKEASPVKREGSEQMFEVDATDVSDKVDNNSLEKVQVVRTDGTTGGPVRRLGKTKMRRKPKGVRVVDTE